MESEIDDKQPSGYIAILGKPGEVVTTTKTIDAIVDVDNYGQLYGVEILWLKDQLGEQNTKELLRNLDEKGVMFSYDDDVDILQFSLTTNIPYINSTLWSAELAFKGATLNAFYLKPRLKEEQNHV